MKPGHGRAAGDGHLASPGFRLVFMCSDLVRFRPCQVRIRIGDRSGSNSAPEPGVFHSQLCSLWFAI